ncbi:hypothetical protein DVK85_12745 [Flavobacterium arcticum]|uniref:Letm1 RBD domain-containing protein n=1 Tax=Flavobacterium arcticum TaxID=1784713 RepID=A0A345HEN9_9FLAO|nr:LETM1-related biofilm-associated protein [Flavobacterium arcticum]AXG75049.1 hypothetical protein DVK85_12745 [Flavobacterium arcticum]KAF2511168.1 hypothetical protein E0W72_07195 [Flavobacterium arcticum]
MINPSASGWIDKYFSRYKNKMPSDISTHEFYKLVRNTGFVYGHVWVVNHLDEEDSKGWTAEETTKAALLNTLYESYRKYTKDENSITFIEKTVLFYEQMTPEGYGFLKRVLPSSPRSHELEGIIDQRVRTNDNIISRNFSHILTNALLFMDVLAFRQYLIGAKIPDNYLRKLEETVVSLASLALNRKTQKTAYDDLLIKLFESSVRYTKLNKVNADNLEKLELGYFESELERYYLLDIAGMAMWSDGTIEKTETSFLYKLAIQLDIKEEYVEESITFFDVFIKANRENIPYFKYSNPVKHFYDHASQNVIRLIKRNKNRLGKELSNNGELMVLLSQSTLRSLDSSEKKKVKKQLLEICKTVPSLTIFLLPGGSLLLPLLIKFIPQLLPSVFNENLDNE